MIKVKVESEPVIHLSSTELDKFIQKTLKWDHYSFASVQGGVRGTYHEFKVDGDISDLDEDTLRMWRSGVAIEKSNLAILNFLCIRGLIQIGKYVVRAS